MNNDKILKEKMMKSKKWAVVGVTKKKDRYGYKIWKILKEHEYTVYGVSPNYDELEGDKLYKSISDLPEKVDVVDMVVSPKIGIDLLDGIKEAGIGYVFFQPGTYNDEVIKKTEELGLEYLTDDCVYATLRNEE
ncbi:MAG: CoA-binding protein [Gudongella sp.]|nr:CoA-binding protein [Gudongella sp.]